MVSLLSLGIGLLFTVFGAYRLYRPGLYFFVQAGVFHREDGEVGPAERVLGRIAAAILLVGGLFFVWLGL